VLNIDVPFHVDSRGRTALTSDSDHLSDMLKLLLFTHPGERVNRPDFGGGCLQLPFNLDSLELAAALKFNLQANLQRWLGDLVDVRDLTVTAEQATLTVCLKYVVRPTNQVQTDTFTQTV
jgi:phage baseplate assembly protein W